MQITIVRKNEGSVQVEFLFQPDSPQCFRHTEDMPISFGATDDQIVLLANVRGEEIKHTLFRQNAYQHIIDAEFGGTI